MRLVAVLLLAGLLAGGAAAADGDPKRQPVPADMAKARSIVLKAADLGQGWKRDTTPDTDDDLGCSYYNPDESDLVETGRAEGNFESQIAFVGSDVSIYRTVAQAQTSWRRGAKPEVARCFAELLARELRQQEAVTVRTVRAGVMPFPRLAPDTAAWKIVLRVTQAGRTLPVNVDLIAFRNARIVALLAVLQFGPAPSAAAERQLAGLIVRRMR